MTHIVNDTSLSAGKVQMVLRPEWGGRVLSLTMDGRDVLYPLQGAAGVFDPQIWPKGGAYPLFPFHNRIPQGRFDWQGRKVSLPLHPQEPNTVHGHAHQRAWQVTHCTAHGIEMRMTDDGQGAWPWPFEAVQRIELAQDRVEVRLSIRNLGDEVMPAGLGWHPFFAKCRRISSDARREWIMGAGFLPTGRWQPAAPQGDATRFLSDWSRVELEFASGLGATLAASPALSHLVLHDPAGPYSCVEPVSHLANSMNLHPDRAADGLVALRPGQTLRADLTLRF